MKLLMPFLFSLITSAATILGGILPRLGWVKRVDSRYLIGFAAGAMVSIAFFDMLPEVGEEYITWVAVGFFLIYLIEKFILLHSCAEDECEYHSLGWPAMIGVGAESLLDGIAISVGYSVNPTLGIAIAVAVIVHEIPRGFTTTVLMKSANKGNTALNLALLIDAGFTPIGVLIGTQIPESYFSAMLGFTCGTFLYVGAADLLPEAHRKFNKYVVFSVLAGVLLIYVVSRYIHL